MVDVSAPAVSIVHNSPAGHFHLHPVDIVKQGGDVLRDEVDHVEVECLVGGDVRGLADSGFGPIRVAATQVRQVADVGDRIVGDLRVHRVVDVAAIGIDRRGRADAGARRHRRDVRGVGDEDTGRCGTGSARRDIGDHRDLALEDRAIDVVHRAAETAGCVDFENDRVGVCVFGRRDSTFDVLRHCRGDRVIDFYDAYLWQVGLGRKRCGGEHRHPQQEAHHGPRSEQAEGPGWEGMDC